MSNCALLIHLRNGGHNAAETIKNMIPFIDKCLYFDLSSCDDTINIITTIEKETNLPVQIISEKEKKYNPISYDRVFHLAQKLPFSKDTKFFWYGHRHHKITLSNGHIATEDDIKKFWNQINNSPHNKFAILNKSGKPITIVYRNINCQGDTQIFKDNFDIDNIGHNVEIIDGLIINE